MCKNTQVPTRMYNIQQTADKPRMWKRRRKKKIIPITKLSRCSFSRVRDRRRKKEERPCHAIGRTLYVHTAKCIRIYRYMCVFINIGHKEGNKEQQAQLGVNSHTSTGLGRAPQALIGIYTVSPCFSPCADSEESPLKAESRSPSPLDCQLYPHPVLKTWVYSGGCASACCKRQTVILHIPNRLVVLIRSYKVTLAFTLSTLD